MYHEIQFLISFENVFLGPFFYLLPKAKRTKYDLNNSLPELTAYLPKVDKYLFLI